MSKIEGFLYNKENRIDIHYSVNLNDESIKYIMHRHLKQYEILLFINGECMSLIEGQKYNLAPNDIVIINNKELHNVVINNQIPYERVVFHFNPSYISEFSDNNYDLFACFKNRRLGYSNLIPAESVKSTNALQIIDSVINYITTPVAQTDIMVKLLLAQLLVELNTACGIKDNNFHNAVSNEKVDQLLEHINNNLSQDLSLDALAKEFYISKHYMCHLFKKITGFGITQYINQKRIIQACELLSSGMSAAEACYACGFNDYSSFYRLFVKLTQKNPNSYKI